MSADAEAYILIYGGLTWFGVGIGAIAFVLSKSKPKWWVSYVAYAGFAVLWGNGLNFAVDPTRYSPANALNSIFGCSSAMAIMVASVCLAIKRARGRVDKIYSEIDDQHR